jgi:transcriptional regulator with XRE-family HTH domain
MKIGENIKHFRELKNYSQKGLAEELGISQPHLSRIEAGADLPFSLVEKAAQVLEVKLEDLITFEPSQYFNNVHNSQIGYNFYYNAVAEEIENLKTRISSMEKRLEDAGKP